MSPNTPSTRPSPRASTTRSAPSRPASSPTSCCGTRRSSASSRRLVIKGGQIAYAQMGDANASIPTPQPVMPRPMFGADGPGPRGQLRQLRVPGGRRGRPAGTPRPRQAVRADQQHPGRHQGRHAGERRPAPGPGRPRHLRRHHRRRPGRTRARRRTAPWPSATSSSEGTDSTVMPTRAALLVLADGRFPAGGHAHSGGAEAAVKAGRIRTPATWRTSAGAGCTPPASPPPPWPPRRPTASTRSPSTRPPTPAPPHPPCGPPPADSAAR